MNISFFVKKISNAINAELEESNILTVQDKKRTKSLDSCLKKERNNKKVLSKYSPYYDKRYGTIRKIRKKAVSRI